MHRTARAALVAVLLPTALGLGACSSGGQDAAPPSATRAGAPSGPASNVPTNLGATATPDDAATIEVTVKNGEITPNGGRVEVPLGTDVVLDVTADAPGEIHVHSSPEQEFEYQAGETRLTVANLDRPGIVVVESHTYDKVIVQLQVS